MARTPMTFVHQCPVRQCPVRHCSILLCPPLRSRPSMSSPAISAFPTQFTPPDTTQTALSVVSGGRCELGITVLTDRQTLPPRLGWQRVPDDCMATAKSVAPRTGLVLQRTTITMPYRTIPRLMGRCVQRKCTLPVAGAWKSL